MLFIQVLFLGVVSLRGGANFIDGDTGRLYQHMVAIWEQGTLFPDGWIYPTTMELDCSLLLALPFYGLTHNAVLAFWCANMIWIVLWICLIVLLAHRLQIRTLAPLAALLVLTPYSCANLYYWNMMFLNASQYAWKVMLPLLLIYLLLEPHPEHPSRRAWFLLLLYEAGLYTTSLSSGVYVAAMGIAPLLILFFLGWLHQKESLTLYTGLCSLGSVAVTLAGVLTAHLLGIHISGGQMIFNSITTFSENAANCFVGFLRLFGAVTRDQTSVTRLAGMAQLLCWVLALAMLGAAVWVVAGIFRRKLSWTERGCWYLAAPALWNFCLLFMLDTTYGDPYFEVRYHLMGGVPLLILVTLLAENISATRWSVYSSCVGGAFWHSRRFWWFCVTAVLTAYTGRRMASAPSMQKSSAFVPRLICCPSTMFLWSNPPAHRKFAAHWTMHIPINCCGWKATAVI